MLKESVLKLTFGLSVLLQQLHGGEPLSLNQNRMNDFCMDFDKSSWKIPHELFIIHTIPKCGTHFIERTIRLMTSHGIVNRYITQVNLEEACKNDKVLRSIQVFRKSLVTTLKNSGHRCLAMHRDPRDALISHIFYMRNYPKNPTGDNTLRDFFRVGPEFDDISFEEQLNALIVGNKYSDSYIKFYKERINWALSGFALPVKYEDLLGFKGGGSDKTQKLLVSKIAKHLNLNLTMDQLQMVLDHMYEEQGDRGDPEYIVEGKAYKRSVTGNWKVFLNSKQKTLIKKMIGQELIQLKYEKNNNW